MKILTIRLMLLCFALACISTVEAWGQATSIPATRQIKPEALAKFVQYANSNLLILQVGSHVLYTQAHIPGSEYIGPANSTAGIELLRKRVEALPRNKSIVLYCGCCPWSHCPNIEPADRLLQGMGFTSVKVLYIANNFGTDWVDKGYPTAKGD